jgi:hypothetical protein
MSRLASLEVDAVSEFIRNGKPCSTAETVKSMAEYYAKDATLIATQMPTVRGRPAIERFWQQACEGAKAAGITRTVHREEAGSEGPNADHRPIPHALEKGHRRRMARVRRHLQFSLLTLAGYGSSPVCRWVTRVRRRIMPSRSRASASGAVKSWISV